MAWKILEDGTQVCTSMDKDRPKSYKLKELTEKEMPPRVNIECRLPDGDTYTVIYNPKENQE